MTELELLAPARNAEIGIAAIDCGADAVYIAGPGFGARKDAGNPTEDLRPLCEYAHKFGARIFVTFNIAVRDDELEEMHAQMVAAQEAGADAFIIRDERVAAWEDITIPLHASTQCAIRTPERARHFEEIGCERIVLERELSLEQIKAIREAVNCELEFFVHGALCVCYSGDCRLSEYIDGRSGDRGDCIQACRSLYDLTDSEGNILVRNKALLSLKDYNLKRRIGELADAGICSFKIEGRLKSISYVKNTVRDYSLALDELVRNNPDKFRRASYGRVKGGFTPDLAKTFNRGYTELFLDGKRGQWSSMDAPKSIGEFVGTVADIRNRGRKEYEILLNLERGTELRNGDGFAYLSKGRVVGFRGDVCEGRRILTSSEPLLRRGDKLFRNISAAFEKELESNMCRREVDVRLDVRIHGKFNVDITATGENGVSVPSNFNCDVDVAQNAERAEALIHEGFSKRVGPFNCRIGDFSIETPGGVLPLLSSSTVNTMRRAVVGDLEDYCRYMTVMTAQKRNQINTRLSSSYPSPLTAETLLIKTKYCIRYELGLCPVHQGAKATGPLFLTNNGRKLRLEFDCKECEMKVLGE